MGFAAAAWRSVLADVHLNSDFLGSLLAIITALGAAGGGTWLLKALADRRAARLAEESGDADRRRAERKDVVQYYEALLERMRTEADQTRQLWNKERQETIRERDRVRADYYQLREEAAQMRDRLAALSGLGSEAIERMDPVIVTNASGDVCWLNDPACVFLGYRPAEILGQTIFLTIPPRRHDYVRGVIAALVERLTALPDWQPIKHYEAGVAQRRDGSTIPIDVVINGFRVPYRPAAEAAPIWIAAFRLHLRPRWTTAISTVSVPDIALNSSDGSMDLTTGGPPDDADQKDQPPP